MKNPPNLKEMSDTQLQAIVDLTEARILKISKDDLRMNEEQLMWSPELEKEVIDYWTTLNKYWKDKKIPPCTCDKYEINSKTGKGFMADPRYNPYYFNEQPCSLDWYKLWKEKQNEAGQTNTTE